MSKQATPTSTSEIRLNQNAPAPMYRQLYNRLRAEILAGQLESGARLPSTRVLAEQLGASRNTIALAYELLQMEGYIESRVGDGTRVARLQPEHLLHVTTQPSIPQSEALARRGQIFVRMPSPGDLYSNQSSSGPSLFRVGEPDVAHFPYETWARLVAKHARHALQAVSLYQNPQGYSPLREAIAAHIGISRGVHCSPEQIVITAGSQGALDLVARVLLNPGDAVWIEEPGYLGARGSLLAAGARLTPVPVDQVGIDVEAGQQLCRDAKLAVVTPSHQFPTGVTMSLSRRLALLEWSREARSWIVEDDYDSEYRFSGRPLEALQGLDRVGTGGRVIYIGTFSKVLFPSLRLGYMVAPPELLEGFIAARRFIDVHPPMLEQVALADFIAEGHFGRHLRRMRLLYLERRNTLVDALTRELGDMVDVAIPEAGMHLVAWLSPGVSALAALRKSSAKNLHILPVSQFSLQPLQRDGLMLGFASSTPEELRAGVQTLARALRGR